MYGFPALVEFSHGVINLRPITMNEWGPNSSALNVSPDEVSGGGEGGRLRVSREGG